MAVPPGARGTARSAPTNPHPATDRYDRGATRETVTPRTGRAGHSASAGRQPVQRHRRPARRPTPARPPPGSRCDNSPARHRPATRALCIDDAQAPRLEQHAEAGSRQALAERGGDTPGDEDVLGRRGAVSKNRGHGQEGAPVVAIWRCGSGVWRPPVHGLPGYQRRGEMASGHAPHTSRHGPARAHRFLTRCSPVRPSRVVPSGTQIIYVRRILLGHSLPSPAGNTGPPPPVRPGTTRARQFVEQQLSFCLTAA